MVIIAKNQKSGLKRTCIDCKHYIENVSEYECKKHIKRECMLTDSYYDNRVSVIIKCNKFEQNELLQKYIKHVVNHEGTDFISKIHQHSDDIRFTDEEIDKLEMLAEEK